MDSPAPVECELPHRRERQSQGLDTDRKPHQRRRRPRHISVSNLRGSSLFSGRFRSSIARLFSLLRFLIPPFTSCKWSSIRKGDWGKQNSGADLDVTFNHFAPYDAEAFANIR